MSDEPIKCPDCNSENNADLDCPECLGSGMDSIDEDEYCEECDGAGCTNGAMECLDCALEFDKPS